MELQRNMKYYELLQLIPGPVTYYDVQKLFAFPQGFSTRRYRHAACEPSRTERPIAPIT